MQITIMEKQQQKQENGICAHKNMQSLYENGNCQVVISSGNIIGEEQYFEFKWATYYPALCIQWAGSLHVLVWIWMDELHSAPHFFPFSVLSSMWNHSHVHVYSRYYLLRMKWRMSRRRWARATQCIQAISFAHTYTHCMYY